MKLIPEIDAARGEIQTIRRDIHAHPELCFEEKRTSDVVAETLTKWGIPIHRGLGKTGLVGIIKNGSSDRWRAFTRWFSWMPSTTMSATKGRS